MLSLSRYIKPYLTQVQGSLASLYLVSLMIEIVSLSSLILCAKIMPLS